MSRIPAPARVALVTALILLVPLIAMQFKDDVLWTPSDFVVAGVLLFGSGLTYELVARKTGNIMYRIAVGVAVATALLLVWVNLAVGIIGSEANPANAMYLGVLAVGLLGAIIARLEAQGMSRALFATALAQAVVAVIALVALATVPAFWGEPVRPGQPSPLFQLLGVNGMFITLFLASALLFRHAARGQAPAATGPEA